MSLESGKMPENSKVIEDGDCAICLEELNPPNPEEGEGEGEDEKKDVLTLKCGHRFHQGCISTWFKSHYGRHKLCPLCRVKCEIPQDHTKKTLEDNRVRQKKCCTSILKVIFFVDLYRTIRRELRELDSEDLEVRVPRPSTTP